MIRESKIEYFTLNVFHFAWKISDQNSNPLSRPRFVSPVITAWLTRWSMSTLSANVYLIAIRALASSKSLQLCGNELETCEIE